MKLETERLILEPPTVADYPEMAAMWGDPEVVRFIGGIPSKPEDTWARLLRYAGHWSLLGFGSWVVRDKERNFVGDVGLFDFHRDIEPPLDVPEVGWVFAKRAHGKGYATEAVQRILAWGEERFGPRTYSCIIDHDNVASHRVAEKCGFRRHVTAVYKGTDVVVYRR